MQRVRKRSSTLTLKQIAGNPAQAEAEDSSKIKDRFGGSAIRGNPSGNFVPECEPQTGASWRLSELDAKSSREDSAGSSDTSSLVLDSICYTKANGIAQGGIKKVTVAYSGVALHGQRVGHREVCAATTVPVNGAGKTILGGWATLTSIKTIGGAPLLAFEKWPVQPSIPKASHAAEHRILIFSTSFSTAPHHTCHYDFHGPGLAHEAGAETAQAANSGQR